MKKLRNFSTAVLNPLLKFILFVPVFVIGLPVGIVKQNTAVYGREEWRGIKQTVSYMWY